METKYFFMGYDFFSKVRNGDTKRKEYENAVQRAVEIQNKIKSQRIRFIQKRPTHIDKLEGEPIFEDVIKTIRECDTAILDLTSRISIYGYNLNVTFELGAAFAGRIDDKWPRYVAYFYHNQTSEDKDRVKERTAKDISDLSLVTTDKGASEHTNRLYIYENYTELIKELSEVLIQRGMTEIKERLSDGTDRSLT